MSSILHEDLSPLLGASQVIQFKLSLFERLRYAKMAQSEGLSFTEVVLREMKSDDAQIVRAWSRHAHVTVTDEDVTIRFKRNG